jgi:hypothetical protein
MQLAGFIAQSIFHLQVTDYQGIADERAVTTPGNRFRLRVRKIGFYHFLIYKIYT